MRVLGKQRAEVPLGVVAVLVVLRPHVPKGA